MENKFDKKYYDDIWGNIGGVHRHDYTESLANRLISEYGKVRFLDIGTGCGELVRVLREKGCEAWGLEISDYCLENSCAKEFVVKGDIRSIPFGSESFDVVLSQGVWGYFPEEDIQKAWNECRRVGKIQDHNIDYLDDIPEHKYSLVKSEQWWKDKFYPKVLVTCPVYDGKEYCFQKWIDMAKSLTYPNYDILVADNSKTEDFYNKYKNQIPMIHLSFGEDEKDDNMYRVCRSMAGVQKYFSKGTYSYWMNIEADNIPKADIIETLFKYSGGDADWVSHGYPAIPDSLSIVQGIGCSLLSRKLMTDFDWGDTSLADDSPDSELWNFVKSHGGYKTCELWYITEVQHIK